MKPRRTWLTQEEVDAIRDDVRRRDDRVRKGAQLLRETGAGELAGQWDDEALADLADVLDEAGVLTGPNLLRWWNVCRQRG